MKYALLLVILLPVVIAQSVAQSSDIANNRFFYGLYGQYVHGVHTADFHELPGYPTPPDAHNFATGSSSGFGAGLLVNIPFAALFRSSPTMSRLRLDLRSGYERQNATLATDEPTVVIFNGIPTPGTFTHTITASFSSLLVTPTLGFSPFGGFQLQLGAQASIPISATFEQTEEITSVDSPQYIYTGNKRTVYTADIPAPTSPQWAAVLGMSYTIPLTHNQTWLLQPEVSYTIPLSDIAGKVQWEVSTLRAGFALMYSPVPPKPVIRDTVYRRDTTQRVVTDLEKERVLPPQTSDTLVEMESEDVYRKTTIIMQHYIREVPPPLSPLTAEITVSTVQNSGDEVKLDTLVVENIIQNTYTPLLPYVFFDDNTSSWNSRYIRLSSQEVNHFRIEQLRRTALPQHYHLLNIIGLRMREHPNAIITLTGCNANQGRESNNTTLSQARANTVKDYLMSAWGIDPSRIRTQARNLPAVPSNPSTMEGVEENRRVEVSSNEPAILRPVFISDTLIHPYSERIHFRPVIGGNVGLTSWNLMLKQSETLLQEKAGNNDLPATIEIRPDEFTSRLTDTPIVYTLIVKDQRGREKSISAALPVRHLTIEEQGRREGNKIIDRYSLVLFDFDNNRLSPESKEIIQFIKGRLHPGSTVTIVGTTDRMGDEEHNKTLSLSRAEAVAQALHADQMQVVVQGAGEDTTTYSNDLPEGRFYSRTVVVIVEWQAR